MADVTTGGRPAAESIAEVVADIRAGRTDHPAAFDRAGADISRRMLERAQRPQPVVDCTAVFHHQLAADTVDLYDDHPSITPPWPDALLCYINTFGNVVCLQVHREDWDGSPRSLDEWSTDNDVDWSKVRWIAETTIWVGGVNKAGRPIPTSGPCHMFRHAISDDGSPEDINWVELLNRGRPGQRADPDEPGAAMWEASLITLGGSLNFLNCSNVDVAEPDRPRPVRRRLDRTGVTVQTIVVRPPGRRTAGSPAAARPIDAAESVLSPVRGHFSHYGPQYGRGLLFGRLAGKFWIPGHVRGAGDPQDQSDPRSYVLKP